MNSASVVVGVLLARERSIHVAHARLTIWVDADVCDRHEWWLQWYSLNNDKVFATMIIITDKTIGIAHGGAHSTHEPFCEPRPIRALRCM